MTAPLPLSGVVITRNEADRIERCLASMRELCDEIIVLDSGSTDATVEIARRLGARVEHRDWDGFARQKNAAIERAMQPWVLLLDADEWLEPPAIAEVRKLFDGEIETADCWLLQRRTHFLGHTMRAGSFAREPVHRLFRRTLRHGDVPVHEYLDVKGWRVRPSSIVLEHDTARSEAEYWQKLQCYARLWARERSARGKRAGVVRAGAAAAMYLVKNLVLRGGVIDGRAGLRFHLLHARYVWTKYRLLGLVL
ncbi:glycosyltransferase family 2 protein [Lysobacter sp. TY2-98]|uniref:glycosyltransferase family 2 protein n=1 Tax=Lysobacter sp. TY2-98 TaxID=2290922 RepID=UPI0013B37C9E|nr:glycosyltransferase family 2 protein [Lysobacter sp. TY2-98]